MPKFHPCARCGKTFDCPALLRRHQHVCGKGSAEKPCFPCPGCEKTFTRQDNLKTHCFNVSTLTRTILIPLSRNIKLLCPYNQQAFTELSATN